MAGAARAAGTAVPVVAIAAMLPPGAAAAPIVEVAAVQRIAVAVIVVHPQAIAGVEIIIVPTAAKADADEAAAIVGRIVAVVPITIVIGIGVVVIDRKSTRLNSSH